MEEARNPEELLLAGETVQFMPKGYSMYPFLNPQKGDQVIVEPACAKQLKRGDVVLYRRDGKKGTVDSEGFECGILVLHRIWKKSEERFYMVGDNQSKVEGPVRGDQVKGIMVARVREGVRISVDDFGYRFWSRVWLSFRPFRPLLSGIAARLKKLFLRFLRK